MESADFIQICVGLPLCAEKIHWLVYDHRLPLRTWLAGLLRIEKAFRE
jgi:hypothetical protein